MALTPDEELEYQQLKRELGMPGKRGLSADEELEYQQLRKEIRRGEAVEIGKEVRAGITRRAGEFFTPPSLEDLKIAAQQGITAGFADELAGKWAVFKKEEGDTRLDEEIYKEARDAFRKLTKEARERSPFTTFITEQIASLPLGGVLGKIPKLGRLIPAGSIRRTMTEAGLMGLGEAEATEGVGLGISAAIPAAIAAGTQLVGKVAKLPFKRPKVIRARALGAGKKEFKQRGMKSPKEQVADAKDQGFLKDGPMRFDLKANKYVKTKGGTKISSKTALEDYEARATETVDEIGAEVDRLVKQYSSKAKYYSDDLDYYKLMREAREEFIEASTDIEGAERMWDKQIQKLDYDVNRPIFEYEPDIELGGERKVFKGMTGTSLSKINKIKSKYQGVADAVYKTPPDSRGPGETSNAKMHESIARVLRQFVIDGSGMAGKHIGDLNKTSTRLRSIRANIRDSIAAADAAGMSYGSLPMGTRMLYLTGRVAETVGGGPVGGLWRAGISEMGAKIPLRPQLEDIIKTAPAREMTRLLGPGDTAVTPYLLEQALPGAEAAEGQSYNLPEELVRKRFPRTTKQILENKDFILARTAQVAPEIFDALSDTLEREPERISEIMPGLTQAMPELFESDPYNRFDGVILDPAGKERARNDTMKDDSLSNTEKIETIDLLNKTGEYRR